MESSSICKNCKKKSVIFDFSSTIWVCSSCGTVARSDDFRLHSEAGIGESAGNIICIKGESYRERKIYHAQKQIEDVTSMLNLSGQRSDEVRDMIERVTEGEFGTGDWFYILIAAVSYIVIRKYRLPSSISEVSAAVGSDVRDVGRMVSRVIHFLDLTLPEFDIVGPFDRAIRSCPSLADVAQEKLDAMAKQGRFLILCCMKWFLTTGRQPLPIVAAVLTLVAEMNQVKVTVEGAAKDVYAGIHTTKLRYKELKETLVRAAQALPWGKDVNIRNVVHNAPSILRYMEMKSKMRAPLNTTATNPVPQVGHHLQELLIECTQRDYEYSVDDYGVSGEIDSKYFEVEDRYQSGKLDLADIDKLKLSQQYLQSTYEEFRSGFELISSTSEKLPDLNRRKRRRENALFGYMDWWEGESNLPRQLTTGSIVEKNIGFDALPPSFVAGQEACERRREKISAAKVRISEILHPENAVVNQDALLVGKLEVVSRDNIDWEDCIIELLLLHHAKEEEIEQGHYNRLLDLYVFAALETRRKSTMQI